mgnify:CR=1 FL=1
MDRNIEEIYAGIRELKQKKSAVILVHNYQLPEIQGIADFAGDSLELARKAADTDAEIIVFCGVRFMAETAKILSPQKKVLLPREEAGCPMAEMITPSKVLRMKKQYPQAMVVSYVNTTADVKAVTDVCCTSANAVEVVKSVEAKEVIFVPDRNLASWVQKNVPGKRIYPAQGYCYVHEGFTKEHVLSARGKHPNAVLLVHPECRPEVVDMADEVLSTSGMLRFAKSSDKKEFIIGTEEGLIWRLKEENPDKIFYSLGPARVCANMKLTRIQDVLLALENEQYEVTLSGEIIEKARGALERMLCV